MRAGDIKFLKCFFVACVSSLLAPLSAIAADNGRPFEQAQKAFESDDYTRAVSGYYLAMQDPKEKKDVRQRLKAEWGLAKSLEAMQLYHSASLYYSRIINRGSHPQNLYFRKALESLGQINSKANLGQAQVVALFKVAIDPANIPGPARGFYFYYKGVEAFSARGSEQFKDANGYFKRVQASSEYYPKAMFHRAVIANISGQHQEAIKLFRTVQTLATDKAMNAESGSWLGEQANLNIARVYYEQKEYREAIAYYAKIPRNSENWLEALFEASWAFLLMEKANNALGNIHTLHSPFFVNRFYPESYILQAVIYLRLCRHDKVETAMTLFKKRYLPVLKDIKSLLRASKDNPRLFFRVVYEYRNGTLTKYKNAWPILDSLSRTDAYKQAGMAIKHSDSELARLSSAPQEWTRVGVLPQLKAFFIKKKTAAISDAGLRLYQQGETSLGYLTDLMEQTKLVTAELLLGKVDALRAELNVETAGKKENFIGGMQALKIGEELEYWPFEGEYWEDELGGYVYNINSKCAVAAGASNG